MILVEDVEFFWIAIEGLKAPLPKNQKPCKVRDNGDVYYFNFDSGESTWDHPCDKYYKDMFDEMKNNKVLGLKVCISSEYTLRLLHHA